jgi:hypothetical protein
MKRPYTVRAATPADLPAQAALFNVCFRKAKDDRTFAWKYLENPDGPAISRVACDERGAVVGGYSYVPRRFLRDGAPVVLMQASDAMTLPEWQGQGIFTGLDDVVCAAAGAAGFPLVWAYSGRLSLKGFLRNGWRHIGDAPLWRRRYRNRRALARLGRAGPVLALAAPVLDVLLGWRDRARLGARAGAPELARLSRFDARADALFAACAPRTGLVGVRSAAWLNWRYVDTPGRRQECFGLSGTDGALRGWVVAELRDGNAFLVDHLAADEAARAALLLAFTALARARGMEEASALLFDHHPAACVLPALGWEPPSHDRPFRDIFPFIVRACRADTDPADFQMTRWHLGDGDRDAEHMSS